MGLRDKLSEEKEIFTQQEQEEQLRQQQETEARQKQEHEEQERIALEQKEAQERAEEARLQPLRDEIQTLKEQEQQLGQLLEQAKTMPEELNFGDAKTALRDTRKNLTDIYKEFEDVLQKKNITGFGQFVRTEEYNQEPEVLAHDVTKRSLKMKITDIKEQHAAVKESLGLNTEERISKKALEQTISEQLTNTGERLTELRKQTPEGKDEETRLAAEKLQQEVQKRNLSYKITRPEDQVMIEPKDWEYTEQLGTHVVKDLVLEQWLTTVDQKAQQVLEKKGLLKITEQLEPLYADTYQKRDAAGTAMRLMEESHAKIIRFLLKTVEEDPNIEQQLSRIGLPITTKEASWNEKEKNANKFIRNHLQKSALDRTDAQSLGTHLNELMYGDTFREQYSKLMDGKKIDLQQNRLINYQYVTDHAMELKRYFDSMQDMLEKDFIGFLNDTKNEDRESLKSVGEDLKNNYYTQYGDPQNKYVRLDRDTEEILRTKGLKEGLASVQAEKKMYEVEADELKQLLRNKADSELAKHEFNALDNSKEHYAAVKAFNTIESDKKYAKETQQKIYQFKIDFGKDIEGTALISPREADRQGNPQYLYRLPSMEALVQEKINSNVAAETAVKDAQLALNEKRNEKPALLWGKGKAELTAEATALEKELENLKIKAKTAYAEYSSANENENKIERALKEIAKNREDMNGEILNTEIPIKELLAQYQKSAQAIEQRKLDEKDQRLYDEYQAALSSNKHKWEQYFQSKEKYSKQKVHNI